MTADPLALYCAQEDIPGVKPELGKRPMALTGKSTLLRAIYGIWPFANGLDEATSALDEATEAEIYTEIRRVLPEVAILSVGHRSSFIGHHDRRMAFTKAD